MGPWAVLRDKTARAVSLQTIRTTDGCGARRLPSAENSQFRRRIGTGRAPRGTRGQAIADLSVSKGTSGALDGTVELTSQQVQALNKSSLYIQIHSEKAPEGNLWGWLFPREAK